MNALWLAAVVVVLALLSFVVAIHRARAAVAGDTRRLHSRLPYYGANAFLFTAVAPLLLAALWMIAQPRVIETLIAESLSPALVEDSQARSLAMSDVRRVAEGLDTAVAQGAMTAREARDLDTGTSDIRARLGEVGVALGAEVRPEVLAAANDYRAWARTGRWAMTAAVLLLALAGFAVAQRSTRPAMRARNRVERSVVVLLIGASTIAILTTAGIVASMLFETINFFSQYPAVDFFFGLTWSPAFQGRSQLGIIPLVWGTAYISLVALTVAVPIGLYAAIYMAEYATPRIRSLVKPLLEVLAGIPTIVYGLFALITVGPILRDYFAAPLGLAQSGSSVMTAGLVMGVMLIPFVSSLSDDIITAVPRSLREGSLGLGATQSETIRRVVLPAALPGIVGAVLLATSRAIGETMIVVLGAGAAAQMGLNPFEAMTTITVKIVSQLTGDTDFNSPETLVAFALGLTLFVATLCLNVLAQWIVRRFREQYE